MWIEILLIVATLFLFLYWFIAKNFGKWERLGKNNGYIILRIFMYSYKMMLAAG